MMRAVLWGAVMLLPIATAADDTVPARLDCLFKPYVGGQLVSGEIIAPETFVQTPVPISFAVTDATTGAATMTSTDQTVPARLEILEPVLRFSYEFTGLSAGAVTISRTWENGGYPAVRSDQGWYDGVLSTGYSSGLCQAPD